MLVKKDTNEPDGVVSTYLDHLEDFDHDRTTHEVLTVPKDHPVFHEQLCWTAPRREVFGALWDRQLTRKPQEQIDAEEAERAARRRPSERSAAEVLLELVNELRADKGQSGVTMDEIRRRQR